MQKLQTLFAPSAIAVVGATDREGAVGGAIFQNLQKNFEGKVYPVNPNRDVIFDKECYQDLASAPEVELVVIVVPAKVALDVLEEAGEVNIDNVIVISAGFSEQNDSGEMLEQQLIGIADEYDINLIGPNSLGVISTHSGMNASFGPALPQTGTISFMSQSGAFVTATIDWAIQRNIGFKDIVSLGNKAVIDETDLIKEWGDDPETDVVIGYLEGIDDGREFIDATRDVVMDTPVVLIKSGQTEAGARAAASHTGTMAGSEQAYEAGLRQAGVLRADSAEQLFDYARALAGLPSLDQNTVAVVTNAGGPGVMATDVIGESKLSLATFTEETIDAFDDCLPAGANIYNPVDIIGDAPVNRFVEAIKIALSDRNVGAVLVLGAPTAVLSYADLAEEMGALAESHDKPIMGCLMGGKEADAATKILDKHGIPNYFDPARAITGLEGLARLNTIRSREYHSFEPFDDVNSDRVEQILSDAVADGRSRLGVESMGILEAYGIPTPEGEIATSPSEAKEIAEQYENSVVMKIVSPDIVHKSDMGGVDVGVKQRDVEDAYERIVTNARRYQPDATILGVQVQQQVDLSETTELIIGTKYDSQFGQLVLAGLGGIFVEIFEDTAVRVGPVTDREAATMLSELRAYPLLRGARGRPAADEQSIIEIIQRLSQLVEDFPAIMELDINPVVARPNNAVAIDLRLTIDEGKL